jgi:hypothetical protein
VSKPVTANTSQPFVVGLGGTLRANSSTERTLGQLRVIGHALRTA